MGMAYVPKHRRDSKDTNAPAVLSSPSSSSFLQKNLKHHHKTGNRGHNQYSSSPVSTWFVVPFNDQDVQLPSSIKLMEFPYEQMAPRNKLKSMVLVRSDHSHKHKDKYHHSHFVWREKTHKPTNILPCSVNRNPWLSVVGKITPALLGTFRNARNGMCMDGPVQKVPHFLFRFGKVLFHDSELSCIVFENIDKSSTVQSALSKFGRSFFSSVPIPFRETIVSEAIQKIGLDFDKEREYYSVKVKDKTQPTNTMTCKCSVIQDVGKLKLHKVELDEERHLVVDISCLDKNLDLRLRLSSKRILSLTDNEKLSLNSLLKAAVIDSKAKGGLRWPLGKKSGDGRYTIVQVCHSRTKLFRSSSMKLKVRRADRFDFKLKSGEVSNEVSLRMTELNSMLRDRSLELNPIVDVVRDTMKLIWDNFLCWEGSFT